MNRFDEIKRLEQELEEANNWVDATGARWAILWAREAEDKLALARAQGCQDNGRSVYQGLFRPFRAWSKTALRALRGSFTFFLLLLACQAVDAHLYDQDLALQEAQEIADYRGRVENTALVAGRINP